MPRNSDNKDSRFGVARVEHLIMRSVFTYAGTPAAVGGGLTVVGQAPLPALFVGLLATLAIAAFRAVAQGDLV